ncbi:TPR domain [Brachionus plicatilis]|uniref:TPR domain n=1 Tax=Brachionus plicatilis TaxID=10195 RepID=A0A3M7P7R2_BRAPC|nr:TPR domain [Brachionus plicatilis]
MMIKKFILYLCFFKTFASVIISNKCHEKVINMHKLHKTFANKRPQLDSISLIANISIPIEQEVLLDHEFLQIVNTTFNKPLEIKNSVISQLIDLIRAEKDYYNSKNDVYFEQAVRMFKSKILKVAILGLYETTYLPWIEAVLLNLNPLAQIWSIDYQPKVYENGNIKWIHVNEFLNKALVEQQLEQFDMVVNYMMIEKVGLGRYGENISVDSDLDTIELINCLLKENGLLILTMSWNKYGNFSYIGFNSGRLYYEDRLSLMEKNFNVLLKNFFNFGSNLILVMEKILK